MHTYTGYVYIWYDTKAKFFYIGGHYGKVNDSYICSNEMMKRAYKKRPETFKFKVLEYVHSDTKALREAEQRWLNMIRDEELYWTPNIYNKTTKYYNKKKSAVGGNGFGTNKGKSTIGGWNRGLKLDYDVWNKGMTGLVRSQETRDKIRASKTKNAKRIIKCETCDKDIETNIPTKRFCSCQCSGSANGKIRRQGLDNTVPCQTADSVN